MPFFTTIFWASTSISLQCFVDLSYCIYTRVFVQKLTARKLLSAVICSVRNIAHDALCMRCTGLLGTDDISAFSICFQVEGLAWVVSILRLHSALLSALSPIVIWARIRLVDFLYKKIIDIGYLPFCIISFVIIFSIVWMWMVCIPFLCVLIACVYVFMYNII